MSYVIKTFRGNLGHFLGKVFLYIRGENGRGQFSAKGDILLEPEALPNDAFEAVKSKFFLIQLS